MKNQKILLLGYFICLALTFAFLLASPVGALDFSPKQNEQIESITKNFDNQVNADAVIRERNRLFPKAVRIQHPKSHGLLEAKFIVSQNLPDKLRQGLFSQPGSYRAWVRFSNNGFHMSVAILRMG